MVKVSSLQSPINRATELHHLYEVVEMTGLEAGVLAVVDERQKFARLRAEFVWWDLVQGAHD